MFELNVLTDGSMTRNVFMNRKRKKKNNLSNDNALKNDVRLRKPSLNENCVMPTL